MANINIFIPPGATSSYQATKEQPKQALDQRFSNPLTINKRIKEARLHDDQRRKLMEEFAAMDLNNDGLITRDELHYYFEHVKVSARGLGPPLAPFPLTTGPPSLVAAH